MKYKKSEAKEYARENFVGVWAASLTPFDDQLKLDEKALRENLSHWVNELNLGGLFIAGKQAEFFSMSIAERKRLMDLSVEVAHEAGNRGGIGHCGLGGVIPAAHLADQGALAVDDLVVREGLHEGLAPLVEHAEGELVVVELAEQRVLPEVAEAIVHPAHVPFEVEAEAARGHLLGHAREGGRFLGDHRDPGLVEMHERVDLPEEQIGRAHV